MKAIVVQYTIPHILSYSSECWLSAPKYVIDNIETSFKKMLTGFLKMRHYIQKMKLTYMSQVVWMEP